MALFGKSCSVCGAECIDKSLNVAGIPVCHKCHAKVLFSPEPFTLTIDELKEHIAYRDKNSELFDSFVPQDELDLPTCKILYNDETRQFCFMNAAQRRMLEGHGDFRDLPKPYLYSYDSIIGYEYYENESCVSSKEGIGKAVGGAVLFGVAGAVVGNAMRNESSKTLVTNMRVTLELDNPYQKAAEFVFKHGNGITYGSSEYVTLKRQIDSLLELFGHFVGEDQSPDSQSQQAEGASGVISPSDEIMKLKAMMDQGIITEDEFSALKQKLISQM